MKISRKCAYAMSIFLLFVSLDFAYARQKNKYYDSTLKIFLEAKNNYAQKRFYDAYGYFDKAKETAEFSREYDKLKTSELKEVKAIARESENYKFRILQITNNFKNIIENSRIAVGMTKEQVIRSLGEPLDIARYIYKWEEYEDWVYGNVLENNDKYVYFKDGVVINWRNVEEDN